MPIEAAHEYAEQYEHAIRELEQYITRAEDGTFALRLSIRNAKRLGIDPAVYSSLKRSLQETNRKIKLHEIDPSEVEFSS
jgi:exonuclease VII small subunit